jgi:2-polyprenyl-3-methyl-5-hydroxy-6-metoxy-1,4-benzoquinol methylase
MTIKIIHPNSKEEINLNEKNEYKFFENIPDLFLGDDSSLTDTQSDFYNDVKFPNYDNLDDFGSLLDTLRGNEIIKKLDDEIPMGSKILEAGCGTGQLSIALSRFGRQIYSIDLSKGSLIEAKKFIDANSINSVNLFRMNIFNLFFEKNSFDVIISNGVIHHTYNPGLAFSKLVKVLKPGGIIIIGLYHSYGRIVQKIRQKLIKLFGNNFKFLDKRFRDNISNKKKYAWFLDQYKNPSETTHTYSEILNWFRNENIEFLSSVPFDVDKENQIFKKRKAQNKLEIFPKELLLALNLRQISEGGFFIMIGKKND